MDHEEVKCANLLDRYLLGDLDEAERITFEEHYFSCRDCSEEVVAAARYVENARGPLLSLAEDGQSTELEPSAPGSAPPMPAVTEERRPFWLRHWLAMTPKPVLAGACICLAAALVWQGVSFRLQPEVTGSYFVTATRAAGGAPRKILVRPGQERIALLFNHTDTTVPRFGFVLESAAGKAIHQFQSDAPKDTNDIQVLIPLAGLGAGIYTLRVRNAATQAEVAALPFELAKL